MRTGLSFSVSAGFDATVLEIQALLGRELLQNRQRRRLRGNVHRADRERLAVDGPRRFQPVDLFVRLQQPVHGDEGVVHLVAEQIAGRLRLAGRRRDLAWRDRHQVRHLLERAIEPLEDAVELDPHRVGDVVAGDVVRRARRAARIRDVVRVILRLEHVHHMGAERLRRLDDERSGGILLPADGERRRGAVRDDARLDQRVDELGGGEEVRLIGRQDEAARIARLRIAQHAVEDRDRRAAAAESAADRRHPLPPVPRRSTDERFQSRPGPLRSASDGSSSGRGCPCRWSSSPSCTC